MASRTLVILAMFVVTVASFDIYKPVRICSSQQMADLIQNICKTPLMRPQKRVLFGDMTLQQFAAMCCSKDCSPLQFIDFC